MIRIGNISLGSINSALGKLYHLVCCLFNRVEVIEETIDQNFDEVLLSDGELSGLAPEGLKLGLDTEGDTFYYPDIDGNWAPVTLGGGGSSARFGFAGEDISATAARTFQSTSSFIEDWNLAIVNEEGSENRNIEVRKSGLLYQVKSISDISDNIITLYQDINHNLLRAENAADNYFTEIDMFPRVVQFSAEDNGTNNSATLTLDTNFGSSLAKTVAENITIGADIAINLTTVDGVTPYASTTGDLTGKEVIVMDTTSGQLSRYSGSLGGDFIPLAGTEVGSPVTGPIEMTEFGGNGHFWIEAGDYPDDINRLTFGEAGVSLDYVNYNAGTGVFFMVGSGGLLVNDTYSLRGLRGLQDFTANITDLDYVQKVYVDSLARPYQVYTALLTQSGTDAPVATILENTLGGTITWTYNDDGLYLGTFSSTFTSNKVFCITASGNDSDPAGHGRVTKIQTSGTNEFWLSSFDPQSNLFQDGTLNNTSIEIRIYP